MPDSPDDEFGPEIAGRGVDAPMPAPMPAEAPQRAQEAPMPQDAPQEAPEPAPEAAPQANPLLVRAPQPGTFVKLPSQGQFYRNPPRLVNGEIEVRPMTGDCEIQLQNPDGLLNDESIVYVIRDCVPGIADPEEVVIPDLDAMMLALHVATYGPVMDVELACAECGANTPMKRDLTAILAGIGEIGDRPSVEVQGMKVLLRPHTLNSRRKISDFVMAAQRAAYLIGRKHEDKEKELSEGAGDPEQAIADIDSLREMRGEVGGFIRDMSRKIFSSLGDIVAGVEISPGEVIADRGHIDEWLSKLKAPDARRIADAAKRMEESVPKTEKCKCPSCGAMGKLEVETNPANFSEAGSSGPPTGTLET